MHCWEFGFSVSKELMLGGRHRCNPLVTAVILVSVVYTHIYIYILLKFSPHFRHTNILSTPLCLKVGDNLSLVQVM